MKELKCFIPNRDCHYHFITELATGLYHILARNENGNHAFVGFCIRFRWAIVNVTKPISTNFSMNSVKKNIL
jgi:hypothetical protein